MFDDILYLTYYNWTAKFVVNSVAFCSMISSEDSIATIIPLRKKSCISFIRKKQRLPEPTFCMNLS